MELKDFDTLEEAQAYELVTDKKQIGSGQARGFFVNNGIWTSLRQIQADITNPLFALADAVIVTASDASSYFGLDTETAEGAGNLVAASTMVAAGIMTEAQKDTLLSLALKSTYPHAPATQTEFDEAKDLGETLLLADNLTQHVVKFKIANAPSKSTSIVIEQQFGDSVEDMTPWHSVGSVTVQYTQSTYKLMVPACESAIRSLRAVSPLTLGLSER